MENASVDTFATLEAENKEFRAITDSLMEAHRHFTTLIDGLTEKGRIEEARTTLNYYAAISDVLSYIFKLQQKDIFDRERKIKTEIAKTTKAIDQIKRWRRQL